MMRAIQLLSIVLISLPIIMVGNAQPPGTSSGHVRGTIFDSNEAVVPNVKVVFEAAGMKREAVTNEEGFYEIELPVGVYRVTTNSMGFCASQRAPFRVRTSSDTLINLTLVVCPLANILKYDEAGKYVGEECRYIDPFESESFPVTKMSGIQLDLLIRYGKRQEKESILEYQGAKVENGVPPGVTVSYDVLTIVADKVRFNKQMLMLEAEGRVVVEDGKQHMKLGKIEIDFKAKQPLATLKDRS
jgi:hypothetical protein